MKYLWWIKSELLRIEEFKLNWQIMIQASNITANTLAIVCTLFDFYTNKDIYDCKCLRNLNYLNWLVLTTNESDHSMVCHRVCFPHQTASSKLFMASCGLGKSRRLKSHFTKWFYLNIFCWLIQTMTRISMFQCSRFGSLYRNSSRRSNIYENVRLWISMKLSRFRVTSFSLIHIYLYIYIDLFDFSFLSKITHSSVIYFFLFIKWSVIPFAQWVIQEYPITINAQMRRSTRSDAII